MFQCQRLKILTIVGILSFLNVIMLERSWNYKNSQLNMTQENLPDLIFNTKSMNNYNSNFTRFQERLWFFKNGLLEPKYSITTSQNTSGDRILSQLMFLPPTNLSNGVPKLKTILVFNGNWDPLLKSGRDIFLEDKCPVSTCQFTANRSEAQSADAILFRDYLPVLNHSRSSNQVWILFTEESPFHTYEKFENFPNVINWTATYRLDSDLPAPYGKFIPYDKNVKFQPQTRNYALNKTRKVAWFVSNCHAQNVRLKYAMELSKFIQVDVYGPCGNFQCPKTKFISSDECLKLLQSDYKFYLSFENCNCKDYITEKFFANGLRYDVIPIVMGARKEEYEKAAPFHSFIHVDDFSSPESLATYLHQLDNNESLYNEYFMWRGTGELVKTYLWCRMCALLHDQKLKPKSYADLNGWWRGPGVCLERNQEVLTKWN